MNTTDRTREVDNFPRIFQAAPKSFRGACVLKLFVLACAALGLANGAGPVISNLQLDDLQKTTVRLTVNTTATGPSSTLAAGIGAGDIALTLTDGSAFPYNCVLVIGSEHVSAVVKNGNTYPFLIRAHEGTTAASHSAGDAVQCDGDVVHVRQQPDRR